MMMMMAQTLTLAHTVEHTVKSGSGQKRKVTIYSASLMHMSGLLWFMLACHYNSVFII